MWKSIKNEKRKRKFKQNKKAKTHQENLIIMNLKMRKRNYKKNKKSMYVDSFVDDIIQIKKTMKT